MFQPQFTSSLELFIIKEYVGKTVSACGDKTSFHKFLNKNSIYILMEWVVIMLRVDDSRQIRKKKDKFININLKMIKPFSLPSNSLNFVKG